MSRHSMKGHRWQKARAFVLERDGHACTRCGATTDLTVDHVTPVALLTDEQRAAEQQLDPEHLVTLCRTCNSSKGARLNTRVGWVNPKWAAGFSE